MSEETFEIIKIIALYSLIFFLGYLFGYLKKRKKTKEFFINSEENEIFETKLYAELNKFNISLSSDKNDMDPYF